MVALGLIGVGTLSYIWYNHPGNDTSPGGLMGLVYAFAGTFFFILAALAYTVRRHSRKRATGQLNAALNWHMFFALIGVAVLFMHSFGHFAAISGTYALLGLVALSLSGIIGRMLDRVLPRLMAAEVDKVLTAQGDDRIEHVSEKLQAVVVQNAQPVPAPISPDMQPYKALLPGVPWDLAYISLGPTQQELDREAPRYRFIPDKKSVFSRLDVVMPEANEHLAELEEMRRAMQREQLYRYVLRYWRVLHVFLAFVTLGLVIWHIVFATTLLLTGAVH